jgi:hypothetical protein
MGRNFIEREEFLNLLDDVPRVDGTEYQDKNTVYGDMSRLVVAWLASTPPDDLKSLYTRLGWKGGIRTARQMHEAAKRWLELHQPGRQFGTEADASN